MEKRIDTPVLECRQLSKIFGAVRALDGSYYAVVQVERSYT